MKFGRDRLLKGFAVLGSFLLISFYQNCSGGFSSSTGTASDNSFTCSGDCMILPAPNPTPQTPEPPITSGVGIGWTELTGTTLLNNLPPNANTDLRGATGPASVISAWSGGIADTKRNRLIFWGGGHNDYYGNELYSLDLTSGQMKYITNPSPVDALNSDSMHCPEIYSDGAPVSRHTYGGLAYISTNDSLFALGGARATCGYGTGLTWNFHFGSMIWQQMKPSGIQAPGGPGLVADFDPNTGLVIVTATGDGGVYAYNPNTNSYSLLSSSAPMDYHMNGVIDPSRKIMVLFGPHVDASGTEYGGIKIIDLAAGGIYQMKDITAQTTGCEAMITSSPGLAYDSSQKLIVGWPNKGSTVYVFNPDTKVCTAKTFTGGPSVDDTGSTWGTFGRFRYFPALDSFALVYNAGKNAFLLKLK